MKLNLRNSTPLRKWAQRAATLLVAMGVCCLSAFAQPKVVSGVVKDAAGLPVIGANVVEKGTTNGVFSDVDGKYELKVEGKSPVIQFSYVGYVTQDIPVGSKTTIDVTLEEDKAQLEEVVVIGYGTARRKDLTGAISTVQTEKLSTEAPRSVADLLRSAAAGLQVGMSSDAAQNNGFSVRGKNTLSAGSSPLIVLDGVIYMGSMSDINPMDIQSVDVLKDASSVAIYGAKAASGVIAITTKKGKGEKPTISFNANIGFVQRARPVHVVDGQGFIDFRKDYMEGNQTYEQWLSTPEMYDDPRTLQGIDQLTWYNYDEKTPVSAVPDEEALLRKWVGTRLNFQPIEVENFLAGIETDWEDIVYQTGLQQDYTASISNRTENTSYYWSVGYADRESTTVGDRFTNLRTRLNLESKVTKWLTVGVNANFAERKGGYLSADTGVIEKNSPYTKFTLDPDDEYYHYPSGDNNTNNPFFGWAQINRRAVTQTLNANLYAKVTLPFGIEYQMNYTPHMNWYEYYNHYSSEREDYAGVGGEATRQHQKTYKWQLDNVVRWNKEFGQHNINITLLANAEKNQYWSDSMTGKMFMPFDILGWHRMQAATEMSITSDDTYDTGSALMARLFYSFRDTYMITASVRRDGYSAFGMAQPFATFPSIALGWTFTNEKFVENVKWLNYGKLRLSWGINGNRDIGRYAALSTLTSNPHPYSSNVDGSDVLKSQLWVDKLANMNLKWEKTAAWNIGLDFGLFNNVLRGSAEFYLSTTNDLLVSRSIPSITGFSTVYDNLGELKNHGFELTLNATPVQNRVVTWDTQVTFSLNRRKITHLYGTYEDIKDEEGNVIGQRELDDINNGWYIGHDTDQIYSYERIGTWQLGEEEEALVYGLAPGDFKYRDVNEDGVLNNDDKVWQGYTSSRYRASWRNEFAFKNGISLSFMMYGNFGHWGTLNRAANGNDQPDRFTHVVIDRWTRENPTNEFGRIKSINKGSNYVTKNFVRMESIALSYRLPKKWLEKIWIQGATISATVRNPFVVCPGWYFGDPEGGDKSLRTWNINLSLTM